MNNLAIINPSSNDKEHYKSSKKIYAQTKGYSFYIEDDNWILDKNKTVYLTQLKSALKDEVLESVLKVLAFYASNSSPAHTANVASYFLHMIKATGASEVTDTMLINYRAYLTTSKEYYLGTVRGFLRKWYELGYYGVDEDVVRLLDSWRIKGNRKGDAVKRQDPREGPLSDIELQAFNEGSVTAFEKSLITLDEFTIALVTSNTGRRPIQISHLRIMDILCGTNKRGDPFYILNVPRAKHGEGFRVQFKHFAVTQDLWAILSAQSKNAISLVEESLGINLNENDYQQVPLFPDYARIAKVDSLFEFRALLASDKLHIAADKITDTLQFIVGVSGIKSERIDDDLPINARRFRYTTGTRAAREGFGELVIAELLDHKDTQTAGVYIKNIPEHVKRLDEAVGFHLAPYAQAFAGVLVDSERDAERGHDLSSRIRTEEGSNIGTCGEHGFCGANVPIPCYTCIHFQPWLDGPHKEVYQDLLDERERIKDITGDIEVAAILDRSIVAVADVIMRCEKRHAELKEQRGVDHA
ncbi:site-specific integrase [Psychrobacter aquimaris]|uniref:site-specific integrase n=1 Tax=Psychrobacter aquimaris TaxID=292733 RepID=UPI003FD07920